MPRRRMSVISSCVCVPSSFDLLGFDLFGHQTDLVNVGALGDIDDLDNIVENVVGIAVDEDCTIVPRLENLGQFRAQTAKFDFVLVDLDRSEEHTSELQSHSFISYA